MRTITLTEPDCMHNHLRRGDLLAGQISYIASQVARAVVMPNTVPPVLSAGDVLAYRDEIMACVRSQGLPPFTPLMTMQLTPATTAAMIREAALHVIGFKSYPRGGTNESDRGIVEYLNNHFFALLTAMADCGKPWLVHAEVPDPRVAPCGREAAFMPIIREVSAHLPDLKIIVEHISSRAAVEAVMTLPANVGATITPHHLFLTEADLEGQPHHHCMPVPKTADDRTAVREAALSGNPKFFMGTDNAPHLREAKEGSFPKPGVCTAPNFLSIYASFFHATGAMDKLEAFWAHFGADFYGLPRNKGTVTLAFDHWIVPNECFGVVPFMAGEWLPLRVLPRTHKT